MARKSSIKGAAAMDSVLKLLPSKIGEGVLLGALRAGAKPIVKVARQKVPKRSGDLAKSITVRKASRRRVAKGGGQVVIGFKKPHSRRAHLTEFGTSKTAAQPFVRPAIDEKGGEAIGIIGQQLGERIEEAAVRLAGPYAKSGLRKKRRKRR